MTLTLFILGHDFAYEMECVARIFFAGAKIKVVNGKSFTEINDLQDFAPAIATQVEQAGADELRVDVRAVFKGDGEAGSYGGWDKIPAGDEDCGFKGELGSGTKNRVSHGRGADCVQLQAACAQLQAAERALAAILFRILSAHTGTRPPWGILTGIRPVRLCEQWGEEGLSEDEIRERLTRDYLVSAEKAALCMETGNAQQKILALNEPDTFSLYVSIPFCPTRCLYCSFVSQAIAAAEKLVPDYIRLLCEEIRHIGALAKEKKLRLLSVYVGGGTPTSLTAAELGQVLAAIASSFDFTHLLEYTVEAGRPDTITREKLEVLRRYGVGRVSVNPQSMNDAVLRAIGRSHTSGQAEAAVVLAKGMGFDSINMDLIAGLPEETAESFAKSLDKVLSLSPENITVHTLTVKRSSRLRESESAFAGNPDTAEMLGLACEKIRAAGYFPYYLYRQKATVENLENIGFTKPNHACVYNIYSMEDRHNILAAGAGGVSKLLTNGGVERIFNFKYPFEYIGRFDEIIKRKTNA